MLNNNREGASGGGRVASDGVPLTLPQPVITSWRGRFPDPGRDRKNWSHQLWIWLFFGGKKKWRAQTKFQTQIHFGQHWVRVMCLRSSLEAAYLKAHINKTRLHKVLLYTRCSYIYSTRAPCKSQAYFCTVCYRFCCQKYTCNRLENKSTIGKYPKTRQLREVPLQFSTFL